MFDISKSLSIQLSIKRCNGADHRILVKYERLPIFCYYCGLLGHEQNRCIKGFEADQAHRNLQGGNSSSVCPLLPARCYSPDTKGVTPNKRLVEEAKIVAVVNTSSSSTKEQGTPTTHSNSSTNKETQRSQFTEASHRLSYMPAGASFPCQNGREIIASLAEA
ncbi:hypothetical protein NE237_027018 [Protea cynaroides]|uniref:Zinc knuckle CX2CX4HX4C domain-containing protein n=1 Tax=Protea cynaroides TaxID=273540 RepID=A0A9Q0GNI5_9MAGN|nr:hypothetical protein NE237_027018 [Protea cynaroides]